MHRRLPLHAKLMVASQIWSEPTDFQIFLNLSHFGHDVPAEPVIRIKGSSRIHSQMKWTLLFGLQENTSANAIIKVCIQF